MPYKYAYTRIPLSSLGAYLKNPALLRRRPKLEYIIRLQELIGRRSRWLYPSAELLGLLGVLSEAVPGQGNFRTAYRLTFFKKARTQAF